MSSPAETVDTLFGWLRQIFGIFLPRPPFVGGWRWVAALFELPIAGTLPDPGDPLPWSIKVAEDWIDPIPGISVSINDIRIQVAADPIYSPPDNFISSVTIVPPKED
jgi:hypothetical protein